MRVLGLIVWVVWVHGLASVPLAQELSETDLLKQELEKVQRLRLMQPQLNSDLSLLKLIGNRSVRNELGIDPKTFAEFKRIESEVLKAVTSFKPPAVEEGMLLRAFETEQLRNLITDQQWHRLKQLGKHVEIAWKGLDRSLAYGDLGSELGVVENQRTTIANKGRRILDASETAIQVLRVERHEMMLNRLPERMRQKAVKELGSYFAFDEDGTVIATAQQLSDDKDLETVPVTDHARGNAEGAAKLFLRLMSRRVRLELGIKGDIASSLDRFRREQVSRYGERISESIRLADSVAARADVERRETAALRGRYAAALEEFLLPDQINRLQQIELYFEIASEGYPHAFTAGTLSRLMEIEPNQVAEIFAQLKMIEKEYDAKIRKVRDVAQHEVLDLLTTEQKNLAKKLLGEYFEYVDATLGKVNDKEKDLEEALGS